MDDQASRGSRFGSQKKTGSDGSSQGEGNYFSKWGWKPLGTSGDRGPFYGAGYPLGLLGQAALFLVVAAVVYLVIPFGPDDQAAPEAATDSALVSGSAASVSAVPADATGTVPAVQMEGYLALVERTASAQQVSLEEHEAWKRDFLLANHALAEVSAGLKRELSDADLNVLRRLATQKTTKEKKDALVQSLSTGFSRTYAEIHRIGVATTTGIPGLVNKAWGYSIEGDKKILKSTGGFSIWPGMTKEDYAAQTLKSVKSDYRRLGAYYLASKMQVPAQKPEQ